MTDEMIRALEKERERASERDAALSIVRAMAQEITDLRGLLGMNPEYVFVPTSVVRALADGAT